MKVILFGATGMVGQGVLRECLLDPEVKSVLSIGRSSTGRTHEKLRELVQKDFFDFSPLSAELTGIDACFFCLGISSMGLSEEKYQRVTYDITLAAARLLANRNAGMTFVFVSGRGTDSSERGRVMWARVKGKTENMLFRLPFKAVMFRPAVIVPLDGVQSKTLLYRIPYTVLGPVLPLLRAFFPGYVTTTRQLAHAMIQVAKHGAPKPILETMDINKL